MAEDIATTVATAVAAIQKAAGLVGAAENEIDRDQIRRLRMAIDELEDKLNEKKRALDASDT